MVLLSWSEQNNFIQALFPKNMFYFFLSKLNYDLEKITPECDTVQGSLKWPGLSLFMPPWILPFLPGLRSTCPNVITLPTDRWNKTTHVVLQNKTSKKQSHKIIDRTEWNNLNWHMAYETLDYRLNNSKQDVFLLLYIRTDISLLCEKLKSSTFCFLLF